MSDQNQSGNILEQVDREIKKAKREALKKQIKDKLQDYYKAKEAADLIKQDIVNTLKESGEESFEGIFQ